MFRIRIQVLKKGFDYLVKTLAPRNTNENKGRGLVKFNVVVFFRGLETQVGSMFTGWGIKEFRK